jgi:hypothetical protein
VAAGRTKARERRREEARANARMRKPQGAEAHGRIEPTGMRRQRCAGGYSDSAGGESLEAEPDLQSVRCAPAAPGGSNGQRQAGAVSPRGAATSVEDQTSEGSNPEGASPVKETDRAGSGEESVMGLRKPVGAA